MDFQKWLDLVRQGGGDPSFAPLVWLESEFKAGVSPVVVAHKLQGMQAAKQHSPPPPPANYAPPVAQNQAQFFSQPKPASNTGCAVASIVAVSLIGFVVLSCALGAAKNANPEKPAQAPVTPRVETAAEKLEKEKARAVAAEKARKEAELKAWIRSEETKRGKYPIASAWDGITPEVNSYLKRNLRDYDSMQLIACYEVITFGDDAWAQRVNYRAKNGFGGTNNITQLFVIRNGSVIDVVGDSN
jgi:hypothetical protein